MGLNPSYLENQQVGNLNQPATTPVWGIESSPVNIQKLNIEREEPRMIEQQANRDETPHLDEAQPAGNQPERSYDDTGLALLQNALFRPVHVLVDIAPLIPPHLFFSPLDAEIWQAICHVAAETKATDPEAVKVSAHAVRRRLSNTGALKNDALYYRWHSQIVSPGTWFIPETPQGFHGLATDLAEHFYRSTYALATGQINDAARYSVEELDESIKHKIERLRAARKHLSALQAAPKTPEVA